MNETQYIQIEMLSTRIPNKKICNKDWYENETGIRFDNENAYIITNRMKHRVF